MMNTQDTMWAVQFRSYGSPEVLEVGTATMPSPGPKDVVVEVAIGLLFHVFVCHIVVHSKCVFVCLLF